MCCLNLRRLLPTRKIWKAISTKLQTKFHILNRSQVIKKSKHPNPFSRASKKLAPLRVIRVQFKTKRSNKFNLKSRAAFKFKKPSPVYIDQLFIENISSVVKEDYALPMVTANKQICLKQIETADFHQGESSSVPSASIADGNSTRQKQLVAADEMWESLTMASPQLHCINERAEEFIARFRADMQRQENLLAYRL